MPQIQPIAQDLVINESALSQLPEELKSWLTTSAGLHGKCSQMGNFGFCDITFCEDQSRIELCSYGRPSEDFRFIWCYDTVSKIYIMLQTPYPCCIDETLHFQNQEIIDKVKTLAQLLHHISTFRV